MKPYDFIFSAPVLSTCALLGVLVGCSSESQNASVVPPPADTSVDTSLAEPLTSMVDNREKAAVDEEHPHKPGSHGGIIIPIGSDSYHAEAVIETGGNFRLMMLGKDESRIQEVEIQPVNAYVKAVGDPDSTAIEMVAVPQDGDAPGMTSQFVGQLSESLRGKQLEVTLPNLRIAGERFRIGFTTVTESHEGDMPTGLASEAERELYLTSGGKYTDADIRANGNVTASQKFKGVKSKHDARPQPGDRICPISMTKANPEFTWIINGKPYQFCCPPCVDEFVKAAKERPDELQDPDTFIKVDDKQK